MVSAIILSAGESQRMGMPKALCRWKDTTFLEAVVSYLRHAGIQKVGVVLGAWEQEIRAHGLPEGLEVWSNPDYQQGQLSSLQIGLKQQKSDILGTVVALVDHPAVTPETVKTLIRTFDNNPEKIVKPTYHQTGGHPILIGRNWWEDIISPPVSGGESKGGDDIFPPGIRRGLRGGDFNIPPTIVGGNKRGVDSIFPPAMRGGIKGGVETLRNILSRHPEHIISVEVNDPGILLDIDTPEILSRQSL